LSIIAASRNDNHGGDLTNRMDLFLRGLYYQLEKYQISAEILIVEWNPPVDRPSLAEILPKPTGVHTVLRIITVPKEIHDQYRTAEMLPLFQMIAKNVGIRKAVGEFVLCTNVDLLFSDKLMHFLSKKQLKKGVYYRCNRCDIPKDINYPLEIPELLSYAKKNILQRLGKNRFFANFNGESKLWYLNIFTLAFVVGIAWLKRLVEDKNMTAINSADTWACGDFTLMHKEDWHAIKGYFELDAYSIHIDSMSLFAALAIGVRQRILPADHCTYHVSHESGWEMQDPMKKIFFDLKMPMLDWNTAHDSCKYMYLNKVVLPINDENWGLLKKELKEQEYSNE